MNATLADLTGDGVAGVIVGAGAGGGPHVKVVDGTKLNQTDADDLPAAGALLARSSPAPSSAG